MGFFSKQRAAALALGPEETKARAMLGVAMIAAASDLRMDEAELDQMVVLCFLNPLLRGLGEKRCKELMVDVAGVLRSQGAKVLLEQAAAVLSPKQAETAICFASHVALTDGKMEDAEIGTLMVMAERLGVPQERFMMIFEVMVMLQRRG